MKKAKTTWSVCAQCNIVISNRFIKRHEREHQSSNIPVTLTSTPQPAHHSLVTNTSSPYTSKDSVCTSTSTDYGFFDDGILHAVITSSKLESEPLLPKAVTEHIVFLSPGTMRVGKIAIGDPIVINNKYCYLAWPNSSVPDCFVYIKTKGKAVQGGSSLLANTLCMINSLPNVSQAKHVKLKMQGSSLPSSVKSESLISFIKQQLYKRILSPGCEVNVNYFGKPVGVSVIEVIGSADESYRVDDSLADDMRSLDISNTHPLAVDNSQASGDAGQQLTSTPVSSKTRTCTPSSTPTSSSQVQLEYGLKATTGRFLQVSHNTNVTLTDSQEEPAPTDSGGCSDSSQQVPILAGVDDLLATLNQLIVEPISKREMYNQYGVKVPRGALLHGPSGCGKTLIANTVGRKLRGLAEFISLDASQLWSKQFGETENRLQNIFQQAVECAPSVIFIDDIDVLCPRRERSQSDLEKRVLSSLITEIDKVTQNAGSYVFVLATTNRIDAVDMTLRRPGRIDRELEVPVPSYTQRQKIVASILNTMLHGLSEQNISDIAADCHGYVGADLQNLCREAGLNAMRNGRSSGISVEDFNHAMSTVQPSAMREIYIDVPKVRWSDIGGQEKLKQSLIQAIVWPLQHADKFQRLGIKPPRGVLMYGPPGCSKTMIAKALATETSLNFISIKGPELFSKWVGESEKAVREIFRKARNAAPSIVFFDEIDAVAVERGSQQGSGGGVGDRVLAQLLTELDGVEGLHNVNIVAATNRPDMIDRALMRPGRLDRLVYVPLPDENTRRDIFKLRLASVPLAEDVDCGELVKRTHMFSGAEIVAVCNESALIAMQENIDTEMIEQRHFDAAISMIKPQTTSAMVKHYEDYAAGTKS